MSKSGIDGRKCHRRQLAVIIIYLAAIIIYQLAFIIIYQMAVIIAQVNFQPQQISFECDKYLGCWTK